MIFSMLLTACGPKKAFYFSSASVSATNCCTCLLLGK